MKKLWAFLRRSAQERPFATAVVIMMIIVTPSFIAISISLETARESSAAAKSSAADAERAAENAERAAVAAQAQADQNAVIINCLTAYVTDLNDTLVKRDGINKTALAAQQEWLTTFIQLVRDAVPEPGARDTFLEASDRLKAIISRLQETTAINPYPRIKKCLGQEDIDDVLMAVFYSNPGARCFNHQVTVRGSIGDDILYGTDGNDVIRSFRGNDIIFASAGNDIMCGGRGRDVLNGGRGFDRGRGNVGSDYCVLTEEVHSC